MVIQRIQTLYLVIAIALTVAFFFVPFGYTDLVSVTGESAARSLKAISEIGLIIPMAVSLLLMVIAIFTFKKPSVQKMFVAFSAILSGAVIITVVYMLVSGFVDVTPGYAIVKTVWGGGGLLMIAALLAQVMAYRGIVADERLLASYDHFH